MPTSTATAPRRTSKRGTNTPTPPPTPQTEERDSSIKRIRNDVAERVTELAEREQRTFIAQLGIVVDAGLKALGEPGLTSPEK